MEKANKYLYETTVLKEAEEKVVEKRVENGETIEVSRTVKKSLPVKIAILRPDRKLNKAADIFYAKRLSAYLKEGLLPHSLVSKRYLNDGGPLSEGEKNLVESLREQYVKLQEEYFSMKSPLTEEQTTRRAAIILELNEVTAALRDIQANYSEVFANTAEAKGKSDVLEWWILALSFSQVDGKEYEPLYKGEDYDSRIKSLEELEAKEDPFLNEVIRKLSYLVSFWYSSGMAVLTDDFKSAEKDYEENVTTYVVAPVEEKAPSPQQPEALPATPVVVEEKKVESAPPAPVVTETPKVE